MRKIDYPIDARFDGKKLYSFLKGEAKLSSKLIRSLKQSENGLMVNGAHARTLDLLRAGDVVSVTIPDDANPAKPHLDALKNAGVVFERADVFLRRNIAPPDWIIQDFIAKGMKGDLPAPS